MNRHLRRLAWMFVLAAVYALAGKAGLLLAIPPGYATAVWPPSGIAAAALLLGGLWLWPGVFLGSLAVNLWTSGDFSTSSAIMHSAMIAGGIGMGATLQAVLAASLVRMSVPHLNIFRLESDVVRLLMIAGPVACVVNATVGVATLFIAGLVPAESFLFNWWTWWIGDSIGVLVFLPLILIWDQRPYSQWWNKQVTVSAPTLLIFIAVVCLFFITSAREETRIRSSFEQQVNEAGRDFSQSVSNADNAMRSLAGFIEASPDGEPEAMYRFTETVLDGSSTLEELQYVRLTKQDTAAKGSGHSNTPTLVSQYLSPNETGLYQHDDSLPFGPDEALRAALDIAAASGKPLTVALPSINQGQPHITTKTIRPLFEPITANTSADPQLIGFLMASLNFNEIAWKSFEALKGIEYSLVFNDLAGHSHLLSDFQKAKTEYRWISVAYSLKQSGGSISVIFRVAPSYFVENRSWQAWGLLAVGLIFTAMLCMVMLVLIGREARVEEIVAEKTRQLRRERNQISNLMSTFPDPHFVTDDRGQIIEINEAALKLLGRKRINLIGASVKDCFEGDILNLVKAQVDAPPKAKFDASQSVFLRTFDQRLIPAAVHVSTFRTEDAPLFAITVRIAS